MDRQCPSCGGFCKKSGCERENVMPEQSIESLRQQLQQVTNAGIKEVDMLRQQLAEMEKYADGVGEDYQDLAKQLAECERERDDVRHTNIAMIEVIAELRALLAKVGADKTGEK